MASTVLEMASTVVGNGINGIDCCWKWHKWHRLLLEMA